MKEITQKDSCSSQEYCQEHSIPCTMQIPVTDRDYEGARHIIPHQMRVLGKYLPDVLISVNRFDKPTNPKLLDGLIAQIASEYSNVRIEEVDYSQSARNWVSENFFGGQDYPMFDFKGSPIHAFIEPFRKSRYNYFFRLESDMMLGGSGPWLNEAIEILKSDAKIAAINPIAGPSDHSPYHSQGVPYEVPNGEGFKVSTFTTRTLLVDLNAFISTMNPLHEIKPERLVDRIFTRVAGYPMVAHLEILFQHKMLSAECYRVDAGGSTNLWTLHPCFKTKQFYKSLPTIINRVESGNLPQDQYRQYDLQQSVFNQTDIPTRSHQLERLMALYRDRKLSGRHPLSLRSSNYC